MARSKPEPGGNRTRSLALYLGLVAIVAVSAVLSISAGQDKSPAPTIAGGYEATQGNACLGETFQLVQSGEFVSLQNTADTLGGALRFQDGKLTGGVDCVDGSSADLDASVSDGRIEGTLDAAPLKAHFVNEPPPAGSRTPVVPGSVAGEYLLSPRTDCRWLAHCHSRPKFRSSVAGLVVYV